MDHGKVVLISLLDLSKCFDVIPHDRLLNKLCLYGVDTRWFESYLSDHYQQVCVRTSAGSRCTSRPLPNAIGTYQGSALAGSAPATDHILLDPRDVKSAVDHMQRVRGEAREQNSEMQRMRDHHLERGWAARSLAGGWGAQLMCQLATGTVTASSLRRVLLMGGAETAWDRLIGPRQSRKPPDLQ